MLIRKSIFASMSVLLLGSAIGACGSDSAGAAGTAGAAGAEDQDASTDSSSEVSTDATFTGPKVRVMAFNVEKFFDTVCDSSKCASGDFELQLTQAQMDAKAQRIADAVKVANPDILMTEEYEKESCLKLVQAKLAGAYPVLAFGEMGYSASLDVGILTRGKLIETRHHKDEKLQRPDGTSTSFSRDLLEVLLDFDGRQVLAFAAHFRSKSTDDPGRRFAEAKRTREIMIARAAELPNAVVVLGGDLNDTPDSDPIKAMTENNGLLRVASDIANGQDWTYIYNKQTFVLDHIMLAPTAGGAYVGASAGIDRGPNSTGLAGSDHCALHADFIFAH